MTAGTSADQTPLLDDLEARGLIQDSTDRDALAKRLAEGPIGVYCGFDPTAPSLHLGNLVPLLLLRRFQDSGHRPIALAGGATGMVGDPSGRSDERNLLDEATLSANLAGITAQLSRFLDFAEGPHQARLVDNRDWTEPMSAIEFLRDVGKHITVNQMMAKESVKNRLESEVGLSFTEFSYMLLQANDFRHLYEAERCEMQVGGSDQWGNITAGTDLIRKVTGQAAFGLTCPLLTRSDGAKFGKTADGAVWLDADRTSPYAFYQYFMQVADDDVEQFLLRMTLLPVTECAQIAAAHGEAPHKRTGQRALAREVTALVHGPDAAASAEEASAILFGSDPSSASVQALEFVQAEVGTLEIGPHDLETGVSAVDLLTRSELAKSNGDARRTLGQGGGYLNGSRLDEDAVLSPADLIHSRFALLRKGKREYRLVVVSTAE